MALSEEQNLEQLQCATVSMQWQFLMEGRPVTTAFFHEIKFDKAYNETSHAENTQTAILVKYMDGWILPHVIVAVI